MRRSFTVPAVILYVLATTGFLLWRGISVSPDYFVFILLFGAVVLGRWKAFIVDWMPLIALFLGYEFLRGFAGSSGIPAHYTEVIAADRVIGFGQLPTNFLQARFYQPGRLGWLDVVTTLFYFMHFAYPMILGYVLWIRDRAVFRRFAAALLGMSYAAFIFFLLVPVAPPWLASQQGLIPHVYKIIDHTLPSYTDFVYQHMNPNKVAAFPSLHQAFPVLGLLYAVKLFGRRAWLLVLWPLAVTFSVVYLGEHYVIDAIGGAALAPVAFFATEAIWSRLRRRQAAEAQPGARLAQPVETD